MELLFMRCICYQPRIISNTPNHLLRTLQGLYSRLKFIRIILPKLLGSELLLGTVIKVAIKRYKF